MQAQVDVVNIRLAEREDLHQLYEMIVESTGNKTKITKIGLEADLFGNQPHKISKDDANLVFDQSQMRTNRNACRMFVAEVGHSLVGYIMFHYFYSPWTSHCGFVDDIFMRREFRNQGEFLSFLMSFIHNSVSKSVSIFKTDIARDLLRHVSELCASEGLRSLIFNSYGSGGHLMDFMKEYDPAVLRNENTDWSVYRVLF